MEGHTAATNENVHVTRRVSRRDMVKHEIDFLRDDPSTMTFSRRAALHLMSRYSWYNPRLPEQQREHAEELDGMELPSWHSCTDQDEDDHDRAPSSNYIEMDETSTEGSFNQSMLRSPVRRERPSLEKAWAYYEHVTLPRYLDHSSTIVAMARDSGHERKSGNTETWSTNDDTLSSCGNDNDNGRGGSGCTRSVRVEKRNHLLSIWALEQHRKERQQKQHEQRDTSKKNVTSNADHGDTTNPLGEFCYLDHAASKEEVVMDLAEPGEDQYPTKLYSPLRTPMNQMGDFGLGVGLYFTALRAITILAFVAGLINIPNMMYFAGDEYSAGQEGVNIMFTLRGSAVCTQEGFVPCPSCVLDDFADVPHRIATAASAYSEEDLIFVMKNYCDGAKFWPLGLVNFATLLFVICGLMRINRHLKEQEVKFDEDEQTAQDYSIVVKNPPPDATDPEEWKAFFDANFGHGVHVTCCTVARDNYLLVRALVRRREILQRLKWKLPPGTLLDVPSLIAIVEDFERRRSLFDSVKSWVIPNVPELLKQLMSVNAQVKKMASLDYPATRIFVTFETEAAQRNILNHLSVGSRAVRKNDQLTLDDPRHLFRSKLVLSVNEAAEPSTIRWHDLSNRYIERSLKFVLTAYAWACAMVLVAFIVRICRLRSAKFAAYAIAFFNSTFPELAKLLVGFESHPSEGRLQTSLYVKIAAFRWINTAIIVKMITPFPSTIGSGTDDLLDGIREIFVAEIVTSNLIKFADPMGFFERHYLAPRASSQEEMNSHMRGEEWHLAERYTNMTKILFLTLWYCSIYPFGFFLCALALFINYFAERFSLMRTWRRAPRLGSYISKISRLYFFTLAVSAMAVSCSYYWAGFPYDNLCENDSAGGNYNALQYYIGSWNVVSIDGSNSADVTVSEGDPSYRFCQQSLYWYGKGFAFPAIPNWQKEGDEWMTKEQELLTSFYGWTSFVLVVAVLLWIIRISIRAIFYRKNYESCGEDQGIPFSDVPSISSYVPEVKSELFSYPLLAVDTDGIDEELYEWKDPDKPYSYYDLTRDARQILNDSKIPDDGIKSHFSTVKHWPPN
mmetsp:Transcript_27370/g.65782  ORF Transcript_27370/g.65782 Transcript_27370/m.65782 type:complete len:1071 (-) Transcript_27370:1369-4581(-)|eukprot:CAMPEP_0181077874 /NCGR_PEP_ID=MMETSP1071-20121207/1188_1 /TAXON_ID=35127 /ORGANISM="Thalassiosira sp., Strain NH16" /LENGTH=1070 /DNA_ID=CAMNT_0023159157 /DNA_START=411 /DNA_END=3623 /DNA_ORIENTATION=+